MPGDLLTAAALAGELGIPESTTRYYLRRYAAWVPSAGEGRGKRYRREALDVLRFVADQHKAGLSADLVESSLSNRFPINAQPQQLTVTTQQQSVATSEDARALLSDLVRQAVRDEVNEVMAELVDLRREVARLTALLTASQGQQGPQETQEKSTPTEAAPSQPVELPQEAQQNATPSEASDPPGVDQVSQPAPARRWWEFWRR